MVFRNCETGHKFHMLIDDFGYEDLVFALAKLGVRICFSESMRVQTFKRHQDFDLLDFNKNDADIILKDHLPTQFEIEKYIFFLNLFFQDFSKFIQKCFFKVHMVY